MYSVLERPPGKPPHGAVVVGAGGGIGSALCAEISARFPAIPLLRFAREPSSLQALSTDAPGSSSDIACDITDESSIARAVEQIPPGFPVQWVFIATGWLHDEHHQPEKTYRSLDAEALLHAYRVNAVGPALLLKALLPRMPLANDCRVGILSARVGSISDNRLGGWHSYRASKAALNMLIRNYAIELARRSERFVIVGLQPGTTDTRLSAPFQRHVPAAQLQTPAFTAQRLVAVMQRLQADDSGLLYDFEGLRFEP